MRRPAGPLALTILALGLALSLGAPASVGATHLATFGAPTAEATFGEPIEFLQPVTLTTDAAHAEILIEVQGGSGPGVSGVDIVAGGSRTLRFVVDPRVDHILPNTLLTARWRIVGTDGSPELGPPVSVRYADTRFDWQTRAGSLVRVHWHEGDAEFGRRALEIGEQAVRDAEDLLGVRESEPVDFFVYGGQEAFYDALGPGTRESVGGQANADIRTLFALITPAEIDDAWVGVVIPHEITHLVFDTAVDNPYHFPPRWLNEGLAVYLSDGYDTGDKNRVDGAVRTESLIPLDGLTGQFPTTSDKFELAYAESVSAVDFLVREYGEPALVSLIRSYAGRLTDDEAFRAALGLGVDEFNDAWFESLDAREAIRYGPQPAPLGPLPEGWTGTGGAPGASVEPARPGETRPPAAAPAPPPVGGSGDQPGRTIALVLGAVAIVLAVVGGLLLRSARRRRSEAAADRPMGPPSPSEEER